MRTRSALSLSAALALSLSAGLGGCASTAVAPADKSPRVELPQMVRADWEGRIVVADFWATWCGPCKASSPNVQALHERFADDPGVLVVGVHADDNPNLALRPADYMAEHGYTYPIVARGQAVGQAFGVHALPTFVVLDRQGNEVLRHVGMMNAGARERIAAAVERLRG